MTTTTAELRKQEAEAEAAIHDARLAKVLADSANLAYVRENERFEFERNGDGNHRVYRFIDGIDTPTVHRAINVISRWDRMDDANPSLPYTFYITSPGGFITPGISLHSFLSGIARHRPLITVVSGYAASMATVVAQAGTERLIEFGSTFLVHNASGVVSGETHSIQDQADWMRRMNADLHRILAEKSKRTVAEIAQRAERRDWNMTADECLEHGFVDRII